MNQDELKERVIKDYLLSGTSVRTLAKRYGYHHSTMSRWVMAYKKRNEKQALLKRASEFEPQQKGKMSTNVEELQEQLYRSQVKIQLLEATIDIADEQLGANIRKKAGPRQS
jgi:transposase-like protein